MQEVRFRFQHKWTWNQLIKLAQQLHQVWDILLQFLPSSINIQIHLSAYIDSASRSKIISINSCFRKLTKLAIFTSTATGEIIPSGIFIFRKSWIEL